MTVEQQHRLWFLSSDFIATMLAWCVFNVVRFNTLEVSQEVESVLIYLKYPTVILGQVLTPLLMMSLYWLSGFYNRTQTKSRIEVVNSTLGSVMFGVIIIYFIAIIDDPLPDRYSNYILLLILAALFTGSLLVGRLFITRLILKRLSRGIETIKTVIIGDERDVRECINRLEHVYRANGHEVVGVVLEDNPDGGIDGCTMLSWATLTDDCKRLAPDKIILAISGDDVNRIVAVTRRLYSLDIPVQLPAWKAVSGITRIRVKNVAGEPLADISTVNITESYRNIKRVTDVVAAAIGLVLVAPVMAVIACMIKADSPGPVFYSQTRVGYRRRRFTIYKFRTMTVDAERSGPMLSTVSDDRITRLGHTLRKYRLDELPQLWNVLKGDMSIIGPRPEREYFLDIIAGRAPQVAMCHQLRPGLTSLGMVKYGYASNVDQMIDRLAYDMIYLENVSLPVDLKILAFTVRTVMTGKGI
ncbi:MAG: sugar transferase [Muribaculaceae bacterium]|nr:sugar transferase [Muribaculaceae bacterium]